MPRKPVSKKDSDETSEKTDEIDPRGTLGQVISDPYPPEYEKTEKELSGGAAVNQHLQDY